MLKADRSTVTPSTDRGALSPIKAFALLLSIVAVVIAIVLLTRDASPAPPPTSTTTQPAAAPTLTNEEAIARLAEIDRLRIDALQSRQTAPLDQAIVPGGPADLELRRTIRQLLRDEITLQQVRFEVEDSTVLRNTAKEIRIRQIVRSEIRFADELGRDVTTGAPLTEQVLIATMYPMQGEWRLFEGSLRRQEVIDK